MNDEKITIRVKIPSVMSTLREVATPLLDTSFSEEWKIEMVLKAYVAYHRYGIEPEKLYKGFFESLDYE